MFDPIQFTAELVKVQSLKDAGGFRVTLDLPSISAVAAARLIVLSQKTGLLATVIMEFSDESDEKAAPVY